MTAVWSDRAVDGLSGPRAARSEPFWRRAWLYYAPLLFLPNMGLGSATAMGNLELSDFLMGPYLLLLLAALGLKRGPRLQVHALGPLMLAFVGCATLSTLLIDVWYGYGHSLRELYGLLKLGKLGLYVTAGVLTVLAFARWEPALREPRLRSLVLTWAVVLSLGIGLSPSNAHNEASALAYKANNCVSVLLAALIAFLVAEALRLADRGWRAKAAVGLALGFLGLFLSEGRGGWFACVCAAIYMGWAYGLRKQTVAVVLVVGGAMLVGYQTVPRFAALLDLTLFPDPEQLHPTAGFAGFDDGSRLFLWRDEGAKFVSSPLLGTGFYHRGGLSGLRLHGSHNFFLQMFLETGLVGGALIVWLFVRIWRQAGEAKAAAAGVSIPVRAAMVAAVSGAMTGEYFYGGIFPFGFVVIYGAAGALPAARPLRRPPPERALA